MPTPISMETWAIIGQWVIYGGGIVGAITAIATFSKWLRSKTSIAKIEEDVKKHGEWLDNDNTRIKSLEEKIAESQEDRKEIHVVERLNLVATQALLKSNLENGNNRAGMQKAYDQIQDYLNSQV